MYIIILKHFLKERFFKWTLAIIERWIHICYLVL
nr:MAG TPA: hypothetical protein [Caudoviricetes sp.]